MSDNATVTKDEAIGELPQRDLDVKVDISIFGQSVVYMSYRFFRDNGEAVPRYSTEIAAAYRIVDRLHDRYGVTFGFYQRPWEYHWCLRSPRISRTRPTAMWRANLSYEEPHEPSPFRIEGASVSIEREGNQLPELICLVALEFVERFGDMIDEHHIVRRPFA